MNVPDNAVLLLIDVQKGLDEPVWGTRNNPGAEANMVRLLEAWRTHNRPVIHIQHMSQRPDSPLHPAHPGNAIKNVVKPRPGEPLIQKQVNSAFIGTDLEQHLREQGCDTLIIVGLTTEHCVSTTTRMAGNLGFHVVLVADAPASFATVGHDGRRFTADEVHALSLATLNQEFATVVETERLLQSLA
ncbi:MAG: cysteine hydrolase [Caldilineaceae bacterium]|nr:cysteine hydrolase [Caldilineaceae bacterium]